MNNENDSTYLARSIYFQHEFLSANMGRCAWLQACSSNVQSEQIDRSSLLVHKASKSRESTKIRGYTTSSRTIIHRMLTKNASL